VLIARPNAKPAAANIVKCLTLWGALVSGLRLGGTNDRITIPAVKSQAAIPAVSWNLVTGPAIHSLACCQIFNRKSMLIL
jgi:hypothetical protein